MAGGACLIPRRTARCRCATAPSSRSAAPRACSTSCCGGARRAFALRFEGRVVAYLNRCAHVPTEMDWQPGRFLDDEGRFIVCAMHGAVYEPTNGRCIAGPCAGARLMAIEVVERDGRVYWYPSPDIGPVVFDPPA